ncbi:MAG: hypothetical protein V3V09_07105 [Arenicellales bacterium]
MLFLSVALIILSVFMAIIGAAVGASFKGWDKGVRVSIYCLMIALSLIPLFLHAQWAVNSVSGWVGAEMYSGLQWFSETWPVFLFGLGCVAFSFAALELVVPVFTPLIAALIYGAFILPNLTQGSKEFIHLDNIPNVWLMIYSLASVAMLYVYYRLAIKKQVSA